MDVAGVALATIISEGISALLIVISLFKSNGFFEFKLKDLKFHRHEGAEIMKIGLPAGIQSTLFSVSNVLIQSSVNSLGTLVVDGNGASSSLEGFIYTSMNCIAQSAVSFVSANYGAKHKKNILKTMFYSMILIILANLLVGGVIGIFNEQLIRLYIQDDVAIKGDPGQKVGPSEWLHKCILMIKKYMQLRLLRSAKVLLIKPGDC